MSNTSKQAGERTRFKIESIGELPRFDYEKQAWIENGRYVRCGHPDSMNCDCYGKAHEGEAT